MPQEKVEHKAYGQGITSYKGALAGKKFESDSERAEREERAAFDKEMKYDGIAGAARKPKDKKVYESQFQEYRKRAAKSRGQGAALSNASQKGSK